MGVFSKSRSEDFINEQLQDQEALQEAFIYMELAKLDDQEKQAFIASEECKAMLEKGIISRKTLVRLNKNDDLTRRTKMAAYQAAKEKNDPLWKALVLNRVKERALIKKIVAKYGNIAKRTAKVGQLDWMKNRNVRPDQKNQSNFNSLNGK